MVAADLAVVPAGLEVLQRRWSVFSGGGGGLLVCRIDANKLYFDRRRNEVTFSRTGGCFEELIKGSWVRGQLWTQVTWTQGGFWWCHTQSVHSQGLAPAVVSYGGCQHVLDLNKQKASVKSSILLKRKVTA